MLAEKETICGNTELLPAFCDRARELMSTKCIEQEVVNELFSNLFLSTNLKYVQYYQMKEFYPSCNKILLIRKEILDIFNILKSLFVKYTITYNESIERNVELYFKELKNLEELCNNQFYNLIDREVLQ